AVARPPSREVEDLRRTRHLAGQRADLAFVAAPERAYLVAVGVVPLTELLAELAELVSARAGVPGLGDELALAQHRIALDHLQHLRVRVEGRLAAEHRREVEAEPGHAALLDPVAQALDHEPLRRRVVAAQRVSGAGIVDEGLPAVDLDVAV